MKRVLSTLFLIVSLFTYSFPQSTPPLRVREVDSSPSKLGVTTLVVSNGSLSISGTTATVTTGSAGIGSAIASGTTGSVLFVGTSSALAQDNSNFFWDDTNNRLGLRTASPQNTLDVHNNSISAFPMKVINESENGRSAIEFFTNGDSQRGAVGYGNSFTFSPEAGNIFLGSYTTNSVILFVDTTERFRLTSSGNVGFSTSTFGTSAVRNLVLASGTAPTTSPADAVAAWVADGAAGAAEWYFRNEAGEFERQTGLTSRVSTQFDKTSDTTLANVTGLTRNVEAGRAYKFEAQLQTTSNVAGGVKAAIAGTATATSITYECFTTDAGTTTQTREAALASSCGEITAVTAATIIIKGTIVVNAAGTLTVQFAQNASNGTASSVLVNSTFGIIPIS